MIESNMKIAEKSGREPVARKSGGGIVLSSMEKKILSTLVALVVIALVFGTLTHGIFFEARNISNLLRQTAINGILAVGMTWVILLAGIDLSVGSIVAVVGIIVAELQANHGWAANGVPGVVTTLGVAIAAGILIGLFNSAWIAGLGIHSFVITFGMMVIARGLAMIFSNGQSISPVGPELVEIGAGYLTGAPMAILIFGLAGLWIAYTLWDEARGRAQKNATPTWRVVLKVGAIAIGFTAAYFGFSAYRGLPYPVLIFGIIAFMGAWILNRTRFGRYIYAVGGNPEAARLAGINVKKVLVIVFTTMGALSGLAGVILTARLNGATPTAGNLFELDAIAAVVIGGTSLMGGKGTVLGSVIGALIIESLSNGMSLMNVPTFYQFPLKGLIVVLAVAIDSVVERRKT
jgi:D-xylose transport system permease protein